MDTFRLAWLKAAVIRRISAVAREGFEGVELGAGLQRFEHGCGQTGGADAVERLEDERGEAVVLGDAEEVGPGEWWRGSVGCAKGENLLDLVRVGLCARGEEHELNVAGKNLETPA